MTVIGASVGTVLLAGVAIALAAADHPRLAVVALAIGVLLIVHILSASTRSPRP